jgi:hypothetical protein
VDVNKVYLTRVSFGGSTHNLMIDTGSSWTWVNSCNSDVNEYWDREGNECPFYYFDEDESTSLECSDETKYIKYGIGELYGNICEENVAAVGVDNLSARMEFLSSQME